MHPIVVGVMVGLLLAMSSMPISIAASSFEGRPRIAAEWTNVTPALSPPAMAGAVLAYDSAANRFVLFGGWNGTTLGETWVLDPSVPRWEKLATRGSPTPRGDAMFAYDSQHDVFVLFGGWYESPAGAYRRLGDTWHLTLHDATWAQVFPQTAPSPRSDAAIAYDPLAGQLVLFGGFDGSNYLGETWRYDSGTSTWTNATPSDEPPVRADGRMAYETKHNRIVLFGGNDFSGPNFTFHHLEDTWDYSWPGNAWRRLSLDRHPSARDYAVFVYDSVTSEFLLHGGFGERVILGDLWAFNVDYDTWREIPVVNGPEPRFAAVGGYGSGDDVFMVFSGLGARGLLADTWFFRYSVPAAVAPESPFGVSVLAAIVAGSAGVGAYVLVRRRPRKRLSVGNTGEQAGPDASRPTQELFGSNMTGVFHDRPGGPDGKR